MADLQIGIVEPDGFSVKAIEQLEKIGKVSYFNFNEDDLGVFLSDKHILFVRLKYFINRSLLDKALHLQFICTPTTGLNHLDMDEIEQRNIHVLSLRNEPRFLSKIRATPEHIFGLTLSLLRNYKDAFLNENNPVWNRDLFRGNEIFGNTVGIVGFGRIGKILARYFKAFGAKVFFYDIDPRINERFGTKRVCSIEELIDRSNIIILCASYNAGNHEFFGRSYMDLLENKFFINAARGELVDENYLIKKIEVNHFKGIALDVIADESKESNHLNQFLELTKQTNLIITPHIAGATIESMRKTEMFLAKKLMEQRVVSCHDFAR